MYLFLSSKEPIVFIFKVKTSLRFKCDQIAEVMKIISISMSGPGKPKLPRQSGKIAFAYLSEVFLV